MAERRYHVVILNERTGRKVYMTGSPVTHKEGCTIMRKVTLHHDSRIQLQELTDDEPHDGETRMLITRLDGMVRAIVCDRCRSGTPAHIVESADVRHVQACATETYEGAWPFGQPPKVEIKRSN